MMSNVAVDSGTTNPGIDAPPPVEADGTPPSVELGATPASNNTVEAVDSTDQGQLGTVLAQLQTLIAELTDGANGSGHSAATDGYSPSAPNPAAALAYATALAEYVKKKESVDKTNAAIDQSNTSLDKEIAAAQQDLAMARVLLANFDRLEAWFGKITPERMSEIATDPTYFLGTDKQFSKEEVLAARYFADNPARLEALNHMYVKADGDGANFCTRSDLEAWLKAKQGEIDSLTGRRRERLAEPVPPVRTAEAAAPVAPAGGAPTAPAATATTASTTTAAMTTSPTDTQGTDDSPPTEPPSGSPLERALTRVDAMRDKIEKDIDDKTSRMQQLIVEDPQKNKELISTLERDIKALSRQESMLSNLESMLEQMIQNIIKMRHDEAMNAIRHIT